VRVRSRFVPIAITIAEDGYGCVAGVDEARQWIRPEPILAAEISAPDTPYHHFTWTEAEVGPPTVADPRPEDRSLSGRPVPIARLDPKERADLIRRILDPDVDRCFSGERTLGLVRARIERIYVWSWVAEQRFIRAVFHDASGARHDWIAPDFRLGSACAEGGSPAIPLESRVDRVSRALVASETFLAVSLTRPQVRFPGKVRGCHPLVVGVHSEPDYLATP
jgi:hypothetical protein